MDGIVMEKEDYDDFNLNKKLYSDDSKKSRKLSNELRKIEFNLDEYLGKSLEYSPELSEAENIMRKYALKRIYENYAKNDKEKAISYLESLLDNSYFKNDYFIYRHLISRLGQTKQNEKRLEYIKKFLKSGIYCNNHQFLWISNILTDLRDENLITEKEIIEHFEYFMYHGNLNKDSENSPVILADRIFIRSNGSVDINSEYTYDFKQIKYEFKEIVKEYKYYGDYQGIIDFYWGVLAYTIYRHKDIYMGLIGAYEELGDYESMFEVMCLFYQKGYTIGPRTQRDFDNWLDSININLHRQYTIKDMIKLSSILEIAEIHKLGENLDFLGLSNDELLLKFADLYEKGLLTKDEFEAKKDELLNKEKAKKNRGSFSKREFGVEK